ncbi:MAG: D-alanyl-D-alanine carboxypeptidase, partial [Clostridia bacterium]|nr:D-alanyl-D-alanine carboxypeptidase [Clostridia bacterium]
LDAMLVPSGNDAAYTIAVGVARLKYGDDLTDKQAVAKFAELMNQTAEEIGTKNSHFSVPDGYYRADHYSTPADLLLIARAAMEMPAIRASVAKPSARCLTVA